MSKYWRKSHSVNQFSWYRWLFAMFSLRASISGQSYPLSVALKLDEKVSSMSLNSIDREPWKWKMNLKS